MAGGGEDEVDGVAAGAGEEVAGEAAALFRWPITGSIPARRLISRRMVGVDAALLAGEEDGRLVGVVAAIAAIIACALAQSTAPCSRSTTTQSDPAAASACVTTAEGMVHSCTLSL